MKVEQIYTGCLAHAAYYVESNGEAAIFDPLREVQPYIYRATKDGAKIKYVFETHFHADFVSGHLDLADKTGAEIVFGPCAKPLYEAVIAEDGQVFTLGDYKIKVLHTPGHTMESTTFLLIDENDEQHGIITGDTLFIGDVGRPDLARHVVFELTQEKLAKHLFRSLREKIMPLADNIIVYPNHGAGSACGKKMSKETTDTLGNQKKTNYALRADMTEDEFVQEVLAGLAPPPGYFPKNVLMNIKGYESFDTVLKRASKPLDPVEFEIAANLTGALILDVRNPAVFADGFIPNSINIGLDGSFANWVGEMVMDIDQKILLVADPGREEEALTRLSRVGYDHTIGYLRGGYAAWYNANNPVETIDRITAAEFEMIHSPFGFVVDVRKKSEYDSEHVINSINVPLNRIFEQLAVFPKNKRFVLCCAGGYRSMIAASILKKLGHDNFFEVEGGFAAISKTSVPKTDYTSPISLL
ncbi:MBL fold metallo-hydrolase [Flavobacterium psychrotrophum]|uniref:MBL fold metallo-hydrolase n=1 Tax=Flavobacterium psychrotrophum TaxID=2294119 RepID=UPI000E30BE84|nr:MBL fold metallo-hydrolase [Flavobacterium psychrotrophum]